MSERAHPIKFNEAEAILFRFFDAHRRHLELWDVETRPEADSVTVKGMFNSVHLAWESGEPIHCTVSRECEIDVAGYDRLVLGVQASSSTLLSVRITVDGTERTVVDRARGNDAGLELENEIGGRRISHIAITVEDQANNPGLVTLIWMGVCDTAARERMRNRPLPYPDEWWDLLVPDDEQVAGSSSAGRGAGDTARTEGRARRRSGDLEPEPQLGIFFGPEELEAVRAKANGATWKPVMDELRRIASGHREDEPWRGIGPTWNNFPVRNGRGDGLNTDHNWIDWAAMRICAFVGLIDCDRDLLRMALYHALAAAYCDHWHPTPFPTLPGSSWETRAFYHYRNAINLIFAWDWAGSLLSDAGKELFAQAVSIKGLPWIHQTLMRHPYVRGNNQGIFFSFGAVTCSAALAAHWPYGGEFIEPAFEALNQTVTGYYAEDGGTFEGIGYATGSLQQALAAYAVYARYKGVDIEEIVPEVVHRIPDYIACMLSTEAPIGAVIKTADGGRAGACVRPGCLGLLARITGDDRMAALLAGLNEQPYVPAYPPGPELNIVFGPKELPQPEARPPVFSILETTGMLCSSRPTPAGPVRVQLVGAPANAGHTHDDKGSFVLEAFGEELAIDRGQMPYVDPRSTTIKYARYHNLLIPEDEHGRPMRQRNPCPEAVIPTGHGNERELECSIEAGGAWGSPVVSWRRDIAGDEPTILTVTDTMELEEPRSVSFHLHSRFPWHREADGWITRGERGELLVTPEWEPASESGEEDFVLGTKDPAYHLTLRAAAAEHLVLITRLSVRPVG